MSITSLRGLCIRCLGAYIGDLAQIPNLDFLPMDVRAALLAIARCELRSLNIQMVCLVNYNLESMLSSVNSRSS